MRLCGYVVVYPLRFVRDSLGSDARIQARLELAVLLLQGRTLADRARSAEAAPVAMDKLVAAVSRRVNPGGQKEVTVRRYGLDQLEVIVPAVDQSCGMKPIARAGESGTRR